jgi:hypothetical protein
MFVNYQLLISNLNSDAAAAKRPERLITKLKTSNIDDKSGKQLMLIRQPRNPDMKIKSFSKQRIERLAGQINDTTTISEAPVVVAVVVATKNNCNDEPKISHFNNLISQA